MYGRCSSFRFRWTICPTVSKAEGTIIPFGSKASNICKNIQDLIYPLILQTFGNLRVANPHKIWILIPNQRSMPLNKRVSLKRYRGHLSRYVRRLYSSEKSMIQCIWVYYWNRETCQPSFLCIKGQVTIRMLI